MKVLIESESGESAILESDGEVARVVGNDTIVEVVEMMLNRKNLYHPGEIDSFPDELLFENKKGLIELKTSSFKFITEYMPELLLNFGFSFKIQDK